MEDFIPLYFSRVNAPSGELATLPIRSTPGSAGFDFFSTEEFEIPPGGFHLFKTGLRVRIPHGKFIKIFPRSGLALKQIDVGAGVIDSDYDGEIGIILYNFSSGSYKVATGNKIAQGVLLDCNSDYRPILVDELPPLEEGMVLRGRGGYGSTGY